MIARITSRSVSGITSKYQCVDIANEHDLALEVIPVLHLDVSPALQPKEYTRDSKTTIPQLERTKSILLHRKHS